MKRLDRPRQPELGDILAAEALVVYLGSYRHRGTLASYADRITIRTGTKEQRFDLVRIDRSVFWKRTC